MAEHLGVSYVSQAVNSPASAPPPWVIDPSVSLTNRATAVPDLTPMTASWSIDPAVLVELWEMADGDQVFLTEYFQSHLEYLPEQMQALQDAIARQQLEEISLAAHSLKGVGMIFHATRFTELCLDIEKTAKVGEIAALPQQLQQLELEFPGLIAALQQELNKLIDQ